MISIALLIVVVIFFFASILLRRDAWVAILLLFTVNDFFYLVPQELLHVENIGKVSDVGLGLGLASILVVKRYRLAIRAVWDYMSSKLMVLLAVGVLITSVVTAIRYGTPLVYALRIGRLYLFYLLFFGFAAILMQRHSLTLTPLRLLRVFLMVAVAYVLQTFLPIETLFYPTFYSSYTIGGIALNRVYLGYLEFYAALFAIFVFVQFVFTNEKKLSAAIAFILFVGQIALTRHRNLWMTTIFGMMISVFMMRKVTRIGIRRSLFRFAILASIVITIGASTGLTGLVADRFSAGLEDSPLAGGTLSGRLVASERYLNLLFDNWILGVGLVHSETGVFQTTDEMDYFSELGSIGFVFHFGILGVVWLALVSLAYHRSVKLVLRTEGVDKQNRAFTLAGYGFFFGTLIMSFLNPGFTMPGGIALLTFVMAHAEATRSIAAKRVLLAK
jgi:hypothetical protein